MNAKMYLTTITISLLLNLYIFISFALGYLWRKDLIEALLVAFVSFLVLAAIIVNLVITPEVIRNRRSKR